MKYKNNEFIIIFGSVARGDYTENSDIDIFLLNITESKAETLIDKEVLPCLPINYVIYDTYTFNKFYNEGSIFLYHILEQGILIHGDINLWSKLKKQFHPQENFSNEIKKIKKEINVFENLEIFNGFYLSPLSNIYPLFKNFCIFSLAQNGIYEFNKRKCIVKMKKYKETYINPLDVQQFYDFSVRGLDINLTIPPNSSKAKNLIIEICNFVRG